MRLDDALAKNFAGYPRMPMKHVVQERLKNREPFLRFLVPRCGKRFVGQKERLQFLVHSGNTCFRISPACAPDNVASWKVS